MLFYLHFGRDFSYLYGGWAKIIVRVRPLYDSETRSVNTQCDITLHTLRPHRSRYTSLWTHTTSPLGRVVARPVLVVVCIHSANVRRCKGRSPYSPGWSGFMPSSCQHLPDKGESKISVWDFLPTTCRQQDVTVENCHVEQMEKEFFCLLPCSMAGRIAVGHVAIVIGQNCRLYCISMFILKIAFAGWSVNICQHARLSCPSTPQLSSNPWSLPKYHPVQPHSPTAVNFFLDQVII